MNSNLIYFVSLVLVLIPVISVAKTNDENADKSSTNVTDSPLRDGVKEGVLYSEGGSMTGKSRIKPRKGAILDGPIPSSMNSESQIPSSMNISSNVPSPATSNQTVVTVNTTISASIQNATTAVITTSSTTVKPTTTTTSTKAPTTTTLSTTTTTKEPIRKPTITYSADDNPAILESEKNINYNVSKIEDVTAPKTSPDTDHRIADEEKSTRRNYIMFMGLAFALPMVFTLAHMTYKRIRNWMEVRHYQRVDFLVDGMYIS